MTETNFCPGVGFYRVRSSQSDSMLVWIAEVYTDPEGVLCVRNVEADRASRLRDGDSIRGISLEKMREGRGWLWEPVEAPKWR